MPDGHKFVPWAAEHGVKQNHMCPDPKWICLHQENLSSIITSIETLPSGYTPVIPKEFMKRSPQAHGADLS